MHMHTHSPTPAPSHMHPVQIDVLRNVMGGVEDTELSFKLTPPPRAAGATPGGTPTLTPPKALLMHQERQMNMISPLSGTALWQADIETGKVVSEWKFQKDGVDVAMKDLATENKAAQVCAECMWGAECMARWCLGCMGWQPGAAKSSEGVVQ